MKSNLQKKSTFSDPSSEENFVGKYTEGGSINAWFVNQYFKAVSELVSIINDPIKTAIEFGCGEGHSTLRLEKILGTQVSFEASEFLAAQVQEAKQLLPHLRIIEESVYELDRENNSADLVFLLEVLEHLEYPQQALSELKRVSAKHLIIGVPREPIWCAMNFARLKYLSNLGNTPGHINHWSKNSFIRLIEKNFGPVIAVRSPLPWTILLAEKASSS